MEIQIAKQDLSAALQVASIGVGGTDANQLTRHFVFRARDGKAEVMASFENMSVSAPLTAAKVDEDGMFTVEAARFQKWIKATGDTVITLTYEKGSINAATTWGQMKFASLDPSTFQSWDDELEKSTSRGTVNADRLKQVVGYLQPFILNMETTYPDKSLTECREGVFFATDLTAVTVARLREGDETLLSDSGLRVHVKHVPKLKDFLAQAGDVEVEIFENPSKGSFYRLPDGSTLLAVRPEHSFPSLNVNMDDPSPMAWTLPTDELSRGIEWLLSGALSYDPDNKASYLINFQWENSQVKMSMRRYQGGGENTLTITPSDTNGLDDGGFPDKGFSIPFTYLRLLLKQFKTPTIEFGLTAKGKKGWTTFRHEEKDDQFVTMVGWQ